MSEEFVKNTEEKKEITALSKIFQYKNFIFLLRLIIGLLFIYASYDKILRPDEFAKAIKNYDILPFSLIHIPAIILPYLELFTGLFLIFGKFKLGSPFLIGLMLIFFLIGLIQAYARGLDINCGCFSLDNPDASSNILLRIFEDILMLIAVVLIFMHNYKQKLLNDKNS
ncbi:MAG: DoxX family membrane protein [Ignavibacteria bacterium]|nr:DoxX family membrane protein [Ignavibacteria bacterium]